MKNDDIDGGREFDWGRTSEEYAAYRQGYPPAFYAMLQALGIGTPEQRILDLGTGTGVLARAFAGSGANPARPLPSFAVALPGGDRLAEALRVPGVGPSVFARIDDGEVLLDLRTLELEDLDEVQSVVRTRLQP